MELEKKREFATYYKLHLDRQLKSRAKRQAVANGGLYVFIGGGTTETPFLKVPKTAYVKTWKNVADEMTSRLAAQVDNVEDCFNLLLPHIERETYSRLAAYAVSLSELDRQFTKRHGRSMTVREQNLYANALNQQEHAPLTVSAQKVRKIWLNSLIKKIKQAQVASGDNLQKAWASVVGTEAAMETVLERVDAMKGIAYCSSLSSVRRFELRRRTDLPALLARQLKMNIKKIVFR